jgi:hypothetical protein
MCLFIFITSNCTLLVAADCVPWKPKRPPSRRAFYREGEMGIYRRDGWEHVMTWLRRFLIWPLILYINYITHILHGAGIWKPTWLGDWCWANVGKYSSTMESMGYVIPLGAANLGCITHYKSPTMDVQQSSDLPEWIPMDCPSHVYKALLILGWFKRLLWHGKFM